MGGDHSRPPPPQEGVQTFKVKSAGLFSSNADVFTAEKDKWLFLKNEIGWFSDHGEFNLTTRKTGNPPNMKLCTCKIEGTDYELKRKAEFEDSDDSDNESEDGLFDGDDDEEVKAKIKWKVKKTATFLDNEDHEFAKLKLKVKGKSKAELEFQMDEKGEIQGDSQVKSETKTKKVVYHLEWPEHAGDEGGELQVEFENGHWHDWDRKWSCGPFEVEYDAKWGIDEVTVQNAENCHPCKALIVGSAMAYFFHPSRFHSDMDGRVRQDARNFLRRKT